MEAVPETTGSADPIHIEESVSFLNGDGHKIVCKSWRADTEPRALVFLAHGFTEHCRSPIYDTLARALVGLGCYVFAHDHVGHGRSEGPRATIISVDTYVDDVLTHVDMRRAEFPDKPVYLIGVSLGGMICVLAVLRRAKDFAGMVLLGPFMGFDKEDATWFKRTMAHLLSWVIPSFPLGKVDFEKASRNPALLSYIDEDPLIYRGSVTAAWAAAALTALEEIRSNLGAVELPFMIQHGSQDKICNPADSQEFFQKAPSKDKTIKMVTGAYHALLVEPDGVAEQVFNDVVAWILARLPQQTLPS
ncbi:monoglyceride lipase-like [Haemaphysalis longicornis]